MQLDFHYYATYCAAFLAGYTHEECMDICYSAQFVDECTAAFLSRIMVPDKYATTQLNLELMDMPTDILGLQKITGIWSSFHFLPYDLYAEKKWASKRYKNKYRLICGPNGELVSKTIDLAKDKPLQAVGIAMHILADTWAHRYFAGTPSLVINNTNYDFYELIPDGNGFTERQISFRHNATLPDDIEKGLYTNSLYQGNENSIMNLGHGRAGHFPDYSFARYKYTPMWGNYSEILKDNPSDYINAFCQMIYAMKYLRGSNDVFELEKYDTEAIADYKERIRGILEKRQLNANADWKAFGEELSGMEIEEFDINKYLDEYRGALIEQKKHTFLGKFLNAALDQKMMVKSEIQKSGNFLAGFSSKKIKRH
ncbi:DUF6765 family protein [Butyrivibrio sp. AD3002]|uniref:DUF6765 family protein n=1 Tax=Butyrivibrio sp. AD3002 TaxID=1280670 RepID=UPI0003B2F3C1|nr:DUF6765 family protein [Butyrivibrio sp. AD3002]